ncbi:MAG: fumarate hydratase C-terminal domain-containing protein, partial [Planctomycetaceae bacterium]|nr:fumarate hydratase C-terminal domain-containing protein [Planctomycetaceae bacterium]
VGFADLGMEAIYEFTVQDMPVTVAVDAKGTSVRGALALRDISAALKVGLFA